MFNAPEKYRVKNHPVLPPGSGNNGCFRISLYNKPNTYLFVIASDGLGWEHVSIVYINNGKPQLPSWTMMCKIKDMFWSEDDLVVQYHPPKSQYVNNHEHCLHLWKPVGVEIPLPPAVLVGIKD